MPRQKWEHLRVRIENLVNVGEVVTRIQYQAQKEAVWKVDGLLSGHYEGQLTFLDFLDKVGEDGWELVTVYALDQIHMTRAAIFKRPKED